jgi:hypothetical protein
LNQTSMTGSWSRRLIGSALAAVLVFVLASLAALAWLGPEPSETRVIEEWNATISKLGIDPVFPPEEDVAVGDIYAVLNDSESGQPSRTALALRSIKLTHVDLTENMEKAHKKSYLFPATKPRPTQDGEPWSQEPNVDGVLKHPEKRTTLPLAAFPGFTIKQQHRYRGGMIGWLSTTFGFQSDTGIELNIPIAETYGISSIEAVGELEQFCADKDFPNRCTDETLRRHLAFVTPRAFELKPKDNSAPNSDVATQPSTENPYRYPLQVVLVNRVYLARYIDQRVQNSRSAQSELQDSTSAAREDKAKSLEGAPAPDAGKRSTGGGLKIETSDGQTLKQTFLRPLVIGYRAVKRVPNDNVIDLNTDTAKEKVAASDKVQNCFNGLGDCPIEVLRSAPPVAINAAQTASGVKQGSNDPRRFRLYLHTSDQSKETVAKVRDALTKAGYPVLASEEDTDSIGGPAVDYFSEGDSVGATSVAKIVSDVLKAPDGRAIAARRQRAYNPIGVLGVWLPKKT